MGEGVGVVEVRGSAWNCVDQRCRDDDVGTSGHDVAVMAIIDDDEFRAWEDRATLSQRGDPVWRFNAYRVALFVLERA